MKRFKDSKQINNLVIAAAPTPPPKPPKFLKGTWPFVFDTKHKPIVDSNGVPVLDPRAKDRIDSAVKAVTNKYGLDEKLAFGVSAVTGIPSFGTFIVKTVAAASPEWQYLAGALAIASGLSAGWLTAKPWIRSLLIAAYPHVEDTLKNIQYKKYNVSETIGSVTNIEEYTLQEILDQLTASGAKFKDGVWTVPADANNPAISRQFENADDVDKINHMLRHQRLSDIRDMLASGGILPASMGITGVGYKWWMSSHNAKEKAQTKAFQAAAPDIRVKEDQTPASKDEITSGMIPVPPFGFQRYTKTRELKNGIIEYYVPAFDKWYRKGK